MKECLGFHVFVFLDFSWGKANKQPSLFFPLCWVQFCTQKRHIQLSEYWGFARDLCHFSFSAYVLLICPCSVGRMEWPGWVPQQMIRSSSFGLERGDFLCLCKQNKVQTIIPRKAVLHCHCKALALWGVFKREQNLGYCKMRESIDLCCSKEIFYYLLDTLQSHGNLASKSLDEILPIGNRGGFLHVCLDHFECPNKRF